MLIHSKFLKYILPTLLCISLFVGCSRTNLNTEKSHKDSVETIEEKEITQDYSINFFGDLLIHNTVYEAAKKGDTYDFTNHFADIADKVKDADMTVGNLEVPLAGSELRYSNYPAFNCPEQIADALKETLDVELLTTATNHSLDKGYKGLLNTISFLDKADIDHIGTYVDKASSEEIYIKQLENGIKIAFLNYTYGTNGIPLPKNHPYSVNLINKDKITSDSAKAKELGADFIIAKLHWGAEYETNENYEQEELAKFLFENTDINLIVGDHPHVVQNIEQLKVTKDGKEKTGTVIYSLGNFISSQNKEYRDTGIIAKANITINKTNPEKTSINSVEYTPVFVDRNSSSTGKRYRVVDINKAINDFENKSDNLISKEEYSKMVKYRDYYRNKLLKDDFVFEY